MSLRLWAKASVLTAAVSAGMALSAAPASAQFISEIFSATPVGQSVQIGYLVSTDSPPFSCKWTARDLDQFGKVSAGARVYTGPSASFSTTTGPYESGHHVQVDLSCRDRSGGTVAESGTVTIP